jgi:hypothetical protein
MNTPGTAGLVAAHHNTIGASRVGNRRREQHGKQRLGLGEPRPKPHATFLRRLAAGSAEPNTVVGNFESP